MVGNNSLLSLSGLEQLQSIGSYLSSVANFGLNDISSLSGITSLTALELIGNYSLYSLSGLDNVTSIEYIDIRISLQLVSLDGLSSLTSITQELKLSENPILSDLSAISATDLSSMSNLTIQENPLLATIIKTTNCIKTSLKVLQAT